MEIEQQIPSDSASLRVKVIDAIRTVFDPEIPIDVYELGLIYEVRIVDRQNVVVVMTLTTPNCPSAQALPAEVRDVVKAIEAVGDVDVQITFDPPWDKSMMSEVALFSIGMF
ncbi:MAG: iron-sulfur cluster assembly protein [Candidatus Kapabacteria bacterium]|nr:iron-sulfur cluster assembly protein [Candidatus Kapabacteria bacterium]